MASQANFYQLSAHQPIDFCCKLALQLWRQQHSQENPSIWLLCANTQQLSELEQQLWQFQQDSFAAMQVIHSGYINEPLFAPICLTRCLPLPSWQGFLFNLSDQPVNHHRARIIEIVTDNNKDAARQRYKHYQSQGLDIKHFKIN